MKILRANLDALSQLAGFDPASTPWHAQPTSTLRFAEILAKIYASAFTTGELLYLFTSDQHLNGDDPFFAQDRNEALDQPFDYPEEGHPFDLWHLRARLLEPLAEEQAQAIGWHAIESAMRTDYGYAPASGNDPLRVLGHHFFPRMMEELGFAATPRARQYRTPLSGTVPNMWNQPRQARSSTMPPPRSWWRACRCPTRRCWPS
ncbi:hypothetical protein G4G28_13375 [Massilia sp. Dwa41.01b]|uniref:hypothetical protein n=1 Tax=unclassified Massilia TaxID=2609279 RepID=UPI001601C0A3|nr:MULTISPECIES: hypothetical protein [unclassified Massilia]QNA89208.1 hypothetical protein G4G28_13375 [Massilia sp. Dwa41.01b]QNB00111.1 hypothetical protein G4G31_16950 [Massilia sp. Se16.2.3]